MIQYLAIGLIVAIFIDISIRINKTSEPFTLFEIWACIFVWPMVVYFFIKGFFDNQQ